MAATAASARVQRDETPCTGATRIIAATTQEQERYHGCKHAKKTSNNGPEAHQTAIRRVRYPKDGAAEKERGSSLHTPPSTLPSTDLCITRATRAEERKRIRRRSERTCYGFPQIPMRPPRRRWAAWRWRFFLASSSASSSSAFCFDTICELRECEVNQSEVNLPLFHPSHSRQDSKRPLVKMIGLNMKLYLSIVI
jgi:hypothetical protein